LATILVNLSKAYNSKQTLQESGFFTVRNFDVLSDESPTTQTN